MLVITKNGQADFILKSNQSKLLKNEGKVGYVLSVFGRKFNQKSIAGILRSGNEGGGMATQRAVPVKHEPGVAVVPVRRAASSQAGEGGVIATATAIKEAQNSAKMPS